jgi:DNA-binding FrmR family transcriptional regulator
MVEAPVGEPLPGGGINVAMEHEFRDGKLFLKRTEEERAPLLQRLRKVEGQVRGIQKMIEQDRYCPEELVQLKAVSSAVRELILVLAEQHLSVAAKAAATTDDKMVLEDMQRTLRASLR